MTTESPWKILNQAGDSVFVYAKELDNGFSLVVRRVAGEKSKIVWKGFIRLPGPVNDIPSLVVDKNPEACQRLTELWAKAYFIRLAALVSWPECAFCANPATCLGAYESAKEGYACDDCCGHACEDGYCASLLEA